MPSNDKRPLMLDIIQRFKGTMRSRETAKNYGRAAEAFLLSLANRAPEPRDAEAFLARPTASGRRPSTSTYNQKLAALRAFATFAIRDGIWFQDPTGKLEFERVPRREPAVLFAPEVQEFLRAAVAISPRSERRRNLALVAVGFTVGLRVSELVSLDRAQLDLTTGTLLRVERKGGRIQALPIEDKTITLLRQWDAERLTTGRPGERALFVSNRGTRISVRTVQRLYRRVSISLGLAKHVTPHTARHSFVTNELLLGAEVTVVSNYAGHASLATTMLYRHYLPAEARRAVSLLGSLIPDDIAPQTRVDPERGIAGIGRFGIVSTDTPSPANDPLDAQQDFRDLRSGAA